MPMERVVGDRRVTAFITVMTYVFRVYGGGPGRVTHNLALLLRRPRFRAMPSTPHVPCRSRQGASDSVAGFLSFDPSPEQ